MSSMSSTPAGKAVMPVRVWVASLTGCRALTSAAEAARLAGGDRFAWIDLEETGDAGLRQISDVLDIGAEAFEMVRRADQRPRFMPLTDATYAAVPVTNPSASPPGHQAYVCLALTGRFLLTRHRTPCPVLAELRDQYSSLPETARPTGQPCCSRSWTGSSGTRSCCCCHSAQGSMRSR